MKIAAIVAMDEGRVIGGKGQLPWKIPEDMKKFSELTTGHIVLMGRKTFESLPGKYRPLPNRRNIVISRQAKKIEEVEVETDLSGILLKFKSQQSDKILWIIGGAEIYAQSMDSWDDIYVTQVDGNHEGDVFFPKFEDLFSCVQQEKKEGYAFEVYRRIRSGTK